MHKSVFGVLALIVISITLAATVHFGAAQSSKNEIANSNPIVNASAGVDGTISPNGVFSISYGSSQVFTVTPDKGYAINQVLMNGTSALRAGVNLISPYSFTVQNIKGATTISATFTVVPSGDPSSIMTSYQNQLIFVVVLVLLLLALAILYYRRHRKTTNLSK